MDYYKELKSLSEQAADDEEFIIAQTLVTLCGVIHSPKEMQHYFSSVLEGYARQAIIELNMIDKSKLN